VRRLFHFHPSRGWPRASAGRRLLRFKRKEPPRASASGQGALFATGQRGQRNGGDGGESNSPSRNLLRRPLRACPVICRRSPGRPSAAYRALQSRPLSGFDSGYATLPGIAPPLNDASAAHGGEAVSTFTLLPKQRGRKQTGCCQLLRLGSFLRGLETNLGSRSPVTGPCRNHASPRNLRPSARGLYSDSRGGQLVRRGSGLSTAPAADRRRPRPIDGAIGRRQSASACCDGSACYLWRPRFASAISRSISRRESRSAISRRRSWSCLPRPRPISSLARPR
jgi:hypothetical protein